MKFINDFDVSYLRDFFMKNIKKIFGKIIIN